MSLRSSLNLGPTFARLERQPVIWIAVFAPLTWAYIAAAFYAVRNGFGVSSVMDLTTDSAEAVLVDLSLPAYRYSWLSPSIYATFDIADEMRGRTFSNGTTKTPW